jgi:hypothetical protein
VLDQSKLNFADVQWVENELLTRIDSTLGGRGKKTGRPLLMIDYRDKTVTKGDRYCGAIMPVVDVRSDEAKPDAGWLVLVQEPLSSF